MNNPHLFSRRKNEGKDINAQTIEVKAIIEKGKDGQYSVRSDAKIGRSYFGGFGESVEVAKDDFLESIKEAIAETQENVRFEDIKVTYSYDMPSFFNYFDFINVSKFSALVGINESKMRQYKSGLAYPGEKTTKKILTAIHRIGLELSSSTI